jgi:diguanylate cyclase (GGDEF)-like protein
MMPDRAQVQEGTAFGTVSPGGVSSELERVESIATYTYLSAYTLPLAVTSILAFLRGDMAMAYTLAVFATAALFIFWRAYRHGVGFFLRTFLIAAAMVLFVYLVLSGGYAGTGLFWCFAMFVVIYHFSTAIVGLMVNLTLIMISALVLLLPVFAEFRPNYSSVTVSRFLVTATITCVLLFVYALVQQVLKSKLQSTQVQLFQASMTDELTGLSNRRSMKDTLLRANQRREHAGLLAIAIADVDHFKQINDSLGHDAGDYVLMHIAQVLRESLRDSDRVARWGGEEFLLLLDVTDRSEAELIIERARTALERNPADYKGQDIKTTASFGVKIVTDLDESLQDAIIAADGNLLRAKDLGRNRVVVS